MSAPHDDLVQAYLDGQLDEAARADFERRLHREPELADQLIRQARDEAIITEWAHANRSVESDVRPARRPMGRRLVMGMAAAVLTAAVLVAFLTTGIFAPHPDAAPSFA
jgi:anti-sigma factor RsiW